MPRMSKCWLGLAAVLAAVLSGGCGFGSSGSTAPDFGFEPDPIPGGGGGGGGGDGGFGDGFFNGRLDQGFGSPDAGVQQPNSCPEAQRRCAWEFVYSPVGNERTVEVLGDYKPNGFSVGDPLTFTGQSWRTAVTIPWNTQVLYRFHIVYQDQTEQTIPDPLNPRKVDDGAGGFNSVITGITCAQWICPGG